MYKLFTNVALLITIFLFFSKRMAGQTADPFQCEPGIYQVVSGQLNILNPNTGQYVAIGDYAGFDYNNMAYNAADGFIYALSRGNGTDALGTAINNRSLIKIDRDGEVFFVVDTGEGGGAYAGDIVDGELWIRRSATRYESIDLSTYAITQHQLSASAPPADWVLIGDYLYGVHNNNSGQAYMYTINTTNNQVASYPITGMSGLSGSKAFGAAYRVNSNQLFVSWNEGGLYILGDYHSSTPTGTYVVSSAVTNSNDGSSCGTAPFPNALLGAALEVSDPTNNGDGSFSCTYTVRCKNLGNMSYFDLDVTDNLRNGFGDYTSGTPTAPNSYTISSGPTVTGNTTDPFTVNSSFTGDPNGAGNADDHLLIVDGNGELDGYPIAEELVITFDVHFVPSESKTSFQNQAVVSGDVVGDGSSDAHFVDFSTEGKNPDPDSDNNPVDNAELTYMNVNENCLNGIDDDEDGFIDCDDVDCDDYSGCLSVGGGSGGGLESNDNLIAKIATREYRRTTSGIDWENKEQMNQIKRSDDYGSFGGVDFRDEFDMQEFMPIDALPDTETFDSTPEDLVDITNAVEVASVDLFSGDQRLAVALGIKSEGVYEHSKYVCDRVKGAEIQNIFTDQLDREHDYIVTYFKNRYGDIEYNTNFSLYIDEAGDFVLESYWDLDDYDDSKTYYNFQIWANGLDRLATITNEIIMLLEAKLPISTYHFSALPDVYASSLYYENEEVVLNMVNTIGADHIILRGNGLKYETGEREDFQYVVELDGSRLQQVRVPTKGLYSFGADIVHSEEEVADVVFTADGFWGLAYQNEFTTVESWDVQASQHEEVSELPEEASWIERNFELKGETENYITVYRSLNPAFRSADFSDYNTLTFEIEGSGEMEITIVKENIARMEDQMTLSYVLDGACKRVYLHREDFDNSQAWDDVKMIYFTQRAKEVGTSQPVDLRIGNVAFVNAPKGTKACSAYNALEVEVYPNPTKGEINFQFPKPDISYELILSNQLGQVVFREAGSLIVDGKLTIDQALEPGLYYYQINVPSGQNKGKILITQ